MSTEINKYSSDPNIDTVIGAKRKRPQQAQSHERHDDIPWTAARCNRLLRTITSRINILRKYAKTNPSDARQQHNQSSNTSGTLNDEAGAVQSKARNDINTAPSPRADDPDWLPLNSREVPSRTYAGRVKLRKSKTGNECISNPKDDCFRTPFAKRLLAPAFDISSSLPLCAHLDAETLSGRHADRKGRRLPILPATSADKAVKALIQAFDTVLANTREPAPIPKLGTRSLLSTCLRKIPDFIDLEQSFLDTEDDAKARDLTTETYEYLETFGSSINGGWPGLRQAVRAHAVHLIGGAISDGTLAGEPVDTLIEVCNQRNAITERQTILRARLESSAGRLGARLEKFFHACQASGSATFAFQTLSELLQTETASCADISTHPGYWTELVRAATLPHSRASAFSFLEAYVAASIRERPHAVPESSGLRDALPIKTLVFLTAFAWIHRSQGTRHDVAQSLHRLALFTDLSMQDRDHSKEFREMIDMASAASMAVPTLMSGVLLQLAGVEAIGDFQPVDAGTFFRLIYATGTQTGSTRASADIVASATDFIFDIGRTIAHVDRVAAGQFIRSTVTGLVKQMDQQDSEWQTLVKTLAAESAMAWAEFCGDKESYKFAEEIEDLFYEIESSQTFRTPGQPCKPVRYRWEEGLCEWIARTPATKDSGLGSDVDDSGSSLHDSGIDMGDEIIHTISKPVLKKGKAVQVREHHIDDEDELALFTPALLRQTVSWDERVSEERDELEIDASTPRKYACRRMPTRVVPQFDDISDDELGFV